MNVSTASFGLIIALAAGLAAAARSPQQPPAPQTPVAPVAQPPGTPATPQPAVAASRRFTSDAGMVFSLIKADKTADFEMVMGRVKEGLARSQDAKRKQQALGWRVFKALEPAPPPGGVLYVWFIDPPVKDVEYTITDILNEAFPTEAQDLWSKYTASFVSGQTMLNLAATINMSPTAAK